MLWKSSDAWNYLWSFGGCFNVSILTTIFLATKVQDSIDTIHITDKNNPNRLITNNNNINKYVSEGHWRTSTHANPSERRISSVKFTSAHLFGNVYIPVGVARTVADSSDFGLLGSKVHKNLLIPCLWRRPAFVAEWLTHSAAMCSRAWRAQWPGFDSARARPPTKELFLMIPMHMMNRELIPGR